MLFFHLALYHVNFDSDNVIIMQYFLWKFLQRKKSKKSDCIVSLPYIVLIWQRKFWRFSEILWRFRLTEEFPLPNQNKSKFYKWSWRERRSREQICYFLRILTNLYSMTAYRSWQCGVILLYSLICQGI